jgi:ribosomal protein S18 acetylase RimI-like enzyme
MELVSITTSLATQAATLHKAALHSGFLSSLGLSFLIKLYITIAKSSLCFGYAAVKDGNLLGFAVFSQNLGGLYREFLKTHWWQLPLLLLPACLFSWQKLKGIIENLFYPNRVCKMDLPDTCLLSIAVVEEARNQHIGKQLIMKGLAECRQRKLKGVRVLTAAHNKPSIALYQKSGFKLACNIESHHVPSAIYVRDLNKEDV